jgi:hypothetical protein
VAFIDRWTEVVAQRTENGGSVGGITSGTRGGEQYRHGALPMRALSGEKGERTGWVCSARGACERHTSEKRNEREGVRYGNEGEKSRADTSAGEKRSVQCKGRGECGAMPRPSEHDSRGSGHRWFLQDTQ